MEGVKYEIGTVVLCIDGMRPSNNFPTMYTGRAVHCRHRCHVDQRYAIERIKDDGNFKIRNVASGMTNTGCTNCLAPVDDLDEFSFMDW